MNFYLFVARVVEEKYDGRLIPRSVSNCENFSEAPLTSEATPVKHRCLNFETRGDGYLDNCTGCSSWYLKKDLKRKGKVDFTSALEREAMEIKERSKRN